MRHIFKNAGTTFDWSLRNNFGEGFLDHREDVLMRRTVVTTCGTWSIQRPDWIPFQPQHDKVTIPGCPDGNHAGLCPARHPYRADCSGLHLRAQVANTGCPGGKTEELRDYVGWRMQADVARTIELPDGLSGQASRCHCGCGYRCPLLCPGAGESRLQPLVGDESRDTTGPWCCLMKP